MVRHGAGEFKSPGEKVSPDSAHRVADGVSDSTPRAAELEEWEARAGFALRAHVLSRVARSLERAKLPRAAAVVKGGALAIEGYSVPWERDMQDLDLIVRSDALDRVVAGLVAEGFALRPRGRPRSRRFFYETVLDFRTGDASMTLELHTSLDRLAERPVDYEAILGRAHPLPGFEPLLAPDPVDHLLLVALHLANHEFWHEPAWRDLEVLLARSAARADDARRLADAWGLRTVLALALGGVAARGHRLPEGFAALARLSAGRRLLLAPFYRVGEAEIARHPMREGWSWVVWQAPLREDLGPWARRLGAFWAARVGELWEGSGR
jgi:hypothetical protein